MTTTNIARALPTRGIRLVSVLCLSLVAALVFALTPAPQAHAAVPESERNTELIITKLQQPEALGTPANGLPLGADVIGDMTPIGGVTFEAKLVPGIDLTTTEGQNAASDLTVREALSLTEREPVADRGVTGANGVLSLGGVNGSLGVGLYLVEETDAPAGVIASAPFLVTLPLAAPTGGDWLYSVYVYPKNAVVEVGIGIEDAAAVSCGDTVFWQTHNAIPHQASISRYVTQNLLAPDVYLHSFDTVNVSISGSGAPTLRRGADFVLTEVEIDGLWGFTVEFTEAGRAKLVDARAANSGAEVVVKYPTRVEAPGIHANEVRLFVDDAQPVIDTAVTKFGPLKILVHEKGNEANVIAGADFKVYLTEADARAKRNPITVHGVDTWVTDADGYITVPCLRFSDFVDGLDREPGDPLFRHYWVAPESYPAGWTGDMEPLAGIVNVTSVVDAQTFVFRVWQKPAPTIPELPLTGGQIAGSAMLAALLVGGGVVLLARRRREQA